MLFSVAITYGYLGEKFCHRLYTEIPPLADNPSPTYTGDLAAVFARS